MRKLRLVAALLAIAAIAIAVTSGAAAPQHVGVYFLQGEQLARVERPGLLLWMRCGYCSSGPTRAEFGKGFRTYVPAGTQVRSVTAANGVATVDLNERFASGNDPGSLLARLSQLVRTLTGPQGATRVRLLMNGGPVAARFPGVSTSDPISFRFLQTPNVPVPRPPALQAAGAGCRREKAPTPPDRAGLPAPRRRRRPLRPCDPGRHPCLPEVGAAGPDGPAGRTDEGPARDRKAPCSSEPGRSRQARRDPARPPGLAPDQQQPGRRTIAVSSGKPSTPTPPGNYRVYAKIARWWSVPFREWLPWALPFVGGIAYHEFQDVRPSPPHTAVSDNRLPSPAGPTTSPGRDARQGDRQVLTTLVGVHRLEPLSPSAG